MKIKNIKIAERIENKLNVRILNVNKSAIIKYREITGDYDISDSKAILKINRNFLVSNKVIKDNKNRLVKAYGNLYITYSKIYDAIIDIDNNILDNCSFRRRCNWKLMSDLNNEIGVKNNVYYKGIEIEESELSKIKREVKEQLGLELFIVANKSIDEYRNTTKGHKDMDYTTAVLKINRDFICSNRILKENEEVKIKAWGGSIIVFDKKENKIIKMYTNHGKETGEHFKLRCNWELKNKLDIVMGLN